MSARPLAGLLGQDADGLLAELEKSLLTRMHTLLQVGAASSEEERYSGSPA